MIALEKMDSITVEDYLAGELQSEIKHEYLDGTVHAMSGGSRNHTTIISNLGGMLYGTLSGKKCQHLSSDFKLQLQTKSETRFYYPDAMVHCGSYEAQSQYVDNPTIVAEVLSPSTRRIDLTEKKEAYLTIRSLRVLLFIEPDFPKVSVFRRLPDGGFQEEIYRSLEDTVPLPEIETSLPLKDLYERIEL